VGIERDRRGLAQRGQLLGPLVQPELVQRDPRIDHRARRALALLLGLAQPGERRADEQVHLVVEAEPVVQLLEVTDQVPQARGQLGGGIGGVGAVSTSVVSGSTNPVR
jgi:hypothetical protein